MAIHHRKKQYLKTVKLLTKVTPQNINRKDKHGRTALHYAALVRSPDVLRHLIQKGSDWKTADENGDTALKFMLKRPIDYINLGPCSTVIYSLLNSSEMPIYNDVHVRCLKLLDNLLNAAKCERSGPPKILRYMALHHLPLSWYTLLKLDADLNCPFNGFPNFFQDSYDQIRQPIATISELLKVFKLNVEISCEVVFDYATIHIMSFYSYFDVGGDYFSTLQKLVGVKGSRMLDKCYDVEGYLPFHRAVLGKNTYAIDWFMQLGVDIWKKTKSGWTSLDLSLTYGQCSPAILDRILSNIKSDPNYEVGLNDSAFWCDTTSTPLSYLHIATVNGLWCLRYIHKNTFIPISRLPFTSCNNTHGINILYLAKLYHDVDERVTKWEDLGLPTSTTISKYPEREAEYHLVYNNFFSTPDVNLNLMFEVDSLDLFQCPGINEFLPHEDVIEEQTERCSIRCWQSALHAHHSFSSTFRAALNINDNVFDPNAGFVDIVPQMAGLQYSCVQLFYKVSSTLWRQVSKAYACSRKCRCLEVMRLLQKQFTSKQFRFGTVGKFATERMGWRDTSSNGDVQYRWPFSFFLKKALKIDKEYEYLRILAAQPKY